MPTSILSHAIPIPMSVIWFIVIIGDYGEADKTMERRLDMKNQKTKCESLVINFTQISRNLGRNISVYSETLSLRTHGK